MNQENLSKERVEEVIKDFPIEPMFNKVVITLNTEEVDNYLVLSDNTMSELQYVIAKGSMVTNLEIGQKVIIDLDKMITYELNPENSHEKISKVKIDPLLIDGVTYAIVEDRYIKAKYK